MHEILGFWHFMFSPIRAPWYSGAFWSNQTQWTVVWLPTLFVLYKKKLGCAEPHCYRLGHHSVQHTHHKTCNKHTNKDCHERLQAKHRAKYPEAHAFLKGRK